MPVQSLLQPLRRPQSGSIFPFVGHAPDKFTQIAQDRLKFPALLSAAAQQAAQLQAPVGARAFGRQQRNAEGHDGQNAEHDQQKSLRRGLAPVNVAQIVDENREAKLLALRPRWAWR